MGTNEILWRRLDTAGHDACRLREFEDGWRLEGATTFRHEALPACVRYEVDCDRRWWTRRGVVRGWIGGQALDFLMERQPDGIWFLNGTAVPGLDQCVDLDLGFTPATNLFQIRRVALSIGQSADVPVAWFDVPGGTLERLHQRYERRSIETYWYESRRFHYSALLHVNGAGFVERYPELWEAEA
ncbi:MAG TPA: putative glycolipid-binding domain-containing protein [Terriglobia bacterium]|nr:putative glycolipid-binding domain-containing protein [Terriglobia bacterium]